MLFNETSSSNASTRIRTSISSRTQKYYLKYPNVKRGELYICDFGEPYGSEQGYRRFALIVQNNVGNRKSPTTIVIACTAKKKTDLPVHYEFVLSKNIMKDYDEERFGKEIDKNTILAEQIKTVDKKRLRKFLGTMTDEFMDEIQKTIDISLDLKRKEKKVVVNSVKDLSIIQIQLLAKVNIDKLLEVSKINEADEIKIEKILKIFGFNIKKDSTQYLIKAIYLAKQKDNFDIDILSNEISNEEKDINKEEIKAIITDIIEEKFKFEKSVTSEFIRLVNVLLTQKPMQEFNEDLTKEGMGKIENLLYKYLKNDLEKLDRSKTIEENIDYFLEDIGMAPNEMIMQSFVIACNIEKITYVNIIKKMRELYPEKSSTSIKAVLRYNFKEWLQRNPELAMKCGSISYMNLLKIFAKQFA